MSKKRRGKQCYSCHRKGGLCSSDKCSPAFSTPQSAPQAQQIQWVKLLKKPFFLSVEYQVWLLNWIITDKRTHFCRDTAFLKSQPCLETTKLHALAFVLSSELCGPQIQTTLFPSCKSLGSQCHTHVVRITDTTTPAPGFTLSWQ